MGWGHSCAEGNGRLQTLPLARAWSPQQCPACPVLLWQPPRRRLGARCRLGGYETSAVSPRRQQPPGWRKVAWG